MIPTITELYVKSKKNMTFDYFRQYLKENKIPFIEDNKYYTTRRDELLKEIERKEELLENTHVLSSEYDVIYQELQVMYIKLNNLENDIKLYDNARKRQ